MAEKRETIDQIRAFDRFYTVYRGFLNRDHLDSGYSVTETRILFELMQDTPMSANRLTDMLRLDKSYVSRMIRDLEQKGLITRRTAPEDKRSLDIQLTGKGQQEKEKLIQRTDETIGQLLHPLDPDQCDRLCTAMKTIIEIFSDL